MNSEAKLWTANYEDLCGKPHVVFGNTPKEVDDQIQKLHEADMAKRKQGCIRCSTPMYGIRGSKGAVCSNCGWKDDCC